MRGWIAKLSRPVLLGGVLLAGCTMRPGNQFVVFFTVQSAALDQPARSVIASAAAAAAGQPGRPVLVEGYTDSIGSPRADMSLSGTRAQTVANALVADGVARSRIVLRPRGQTGNDPGVESRRVVIELDR